MSPPGHLAHESFEQVILECGHHAAGHVVSVYPNGRRLYRCNECGGLKARKKGRWKAPAMMSRPSE